MQSHCAYMVTRKQYMVYISLCSRKLGLILDFELNIPIHSQSCNSNENHLLPIPSKKYSINNNEMKCIKIYFLVI